MLLRLSTATFCSLLVTGAHADDYWYGSVSGGGAFLDDFGVRGLDYNGQSLPATRLRDNFETGYFAGFALGRSIADHWRVETEFRYQNNDLDSAGIRADGGLGAALGGNPITHARFSGAGGLESEMLFGNAFYEFNYYQFRPYFGGGLGLAHLNMSDARITHIQNSQPSAPSNEAVNALGDDTVFAYQLGAGISYPIRPGLAASLDYRFVEAINPRFNSSDGVSTFAPEYRTNNVGLSVRFAF